MNKLVKYGILGGLGLLIVFGLVLAATFSLPELEEFREIRIKEMQEQQLLTDFICTVRNDNFYALRAYDLDYVVSYQDTIIGSGKVEKVRLGANAVTELSLPASLELQGITATHSTMLASPQCTLRILINGRFSRLRYRHEFVAEAVISPKSLLSSMLDKAFAEAGPEFKNVRLSSISPSISRFQADAEFKNPLPIPYSVTEMDMKVSGEKTRGEEIGQWKLGKPVEVAAGGLARIPVKVELSNKRATKDILSNVFNRLKKYYVWGSIQVDLNGMKYDIPVEGIFEFDILRQKWEFKNV